MPATQETTTRVPRCGDIVGRSVHLREVRSDSREADFVFSTAAQDRYGESVEQVWRLDNFLANPVALYAHNNSDLPIGTARNVGVVDGELRGTIAFHKRTEKAEQVWGLVQDGVLRAVSVGFYPHTTKWEKRDDEDVLVLTDNELVEISVVPVPANPEALARMRERAIRMPTDTEAPSESATDEPATPVEDDNVPDQEQSDPVPDEGTADPDKGTDAPAPAEDETRPADDDVDAPEPAVVDPFEVPDAVVPEADVPGEEPDAEVAEAPVAEAECAAEWDSATVALHEATLDALAEVAREARRDVLSPDELAAVTPSFAAAEALQRRLADVEAAHGKAMARVAELESELASRDLDALVGVKLSAAEVDGMLALYRADRKAYETSLAAVRARPDLPMAAKRSAIGPDPAPPKRLAGGLSDDCGAGLAEAANRRARVR